MLRKNILLLSFFLLSVTQALQDPIAVYPLYRIIMTVRDLSAIPFCSEAENCFFIDVNEEALKDLKGDLVYIPNFGVFRQTTQVSNSESETRGAHYELMKSPRKSSKLRTANLRWNIRLKKLDATILTGKDGKLGRSRILNCGSACHYVVEDKVKKSRNGQ